MNEPEDRAWLAALAGRRDDSSEDSPAAVEAARLREAVLARAQPPEPSVARVDPEREAALIARARAAGLFDPVAPTRRSASWSRRFALAAALVAAAGLGFFLALPRTPDPVRSVSGIVRLEAEDPLATQTRLLRELEAAGVEVTAYERLGRYGLDADLPRPLPADVRRVLDSYGIALPQDDVLRVEIRPPEPGP